MIEVDIKQLIIKAKKGDSEAFGLVYSEYLTPIYRYIYFRVRNKAIADDLTQDVFLKVFNSLDRFVVTDKSPLTYFFTVARNLLIDNYSKKKILTMNEEEIEEKLIDENSPEKQIILKNNLEKLMEALHRINENEAEVLILKFIDNYSNKEIGQIMEKSEEAIRQLQSRGLKSLRFFIKKEDFF